MQVEVEFHGVLRVSGGSEGGRVEGVGRHATNIAYRAGGCK
jgi:hypothetical protein